MKFDEFLDKWVCNESLQMLDKQCCVSIQGIQCVIRTFEKETPFIWAVGYHPISGWKEFSTFDWSDVDEALSRHYNLESFDV